MGTWLRRAVLVLGLCVMGACTGASSASRTTPPDRTDAGASTTTTTTNAVNAIPAAFPRFLVATPDPREGLLAVEIRTGNQFPLVSQAAPPPGLRPGPWTVSGFDVSPDGRSVAFGVVSFDSSRASNAPSTTAAAIYLEPIDGSSPPRRIRVITGPNPFVYVGRFSPDGHWLVGATTHWTVWPVGAGAPIVSDVLSPYADAGITWSPDGTRIVYGEHHERNSDLRTSMLRFDAVHRTLTSATFPNGAATISGTKPWYSADGGLFVITDPKAVAAGPDDVDASFQWGITASLAWWPTSTGPASGRALVLRGLGTVVQVAW